MIGIFANYVDTCQHLEYQGATWMAARPIHPNKEIEAAIQYAEAKGWRYKASGKSAHAWGRLLCAFADRGGCQMSVWSTPASPEDHAKAIRRKAEKCPHQVA